MSDRELLELAAKATGFLNWTWRGESLFVETGHSRANTGYFWNPLESDGDALRLAVKLMFDIEVLAYATQINYIVNGDVRHCNVGSNEGAYSNNDPYAATRRAIVHAAAEIGKGMK